LVIIEVSDPAGTFWTAIVYFKFFTYFVDGMSADVRVAENISVLIDSIWSREFVLLVCKKRTKNL